MTEFFCPFVGKLTLKLKPLSSWGRCCQVRRQLRPTEGDFLPGSQEGQRKTSCFLRLRPEPDGERRLRPASSAPEHEDHDHQGALAAPGLGQPAEARGSGGRSQRAVLRLCGWKQLLLAGDWPERQTAASCRGGCHSDGGVSPEVTSLQVL